MTKDVARTNGDYVQPAVDRTKKLITGLQKWARENPDEVILAATPVVGVYMATRRHDLSWTEALILSELAYWCGALAVAQYRRWKSQPAGGGPRLRKVS
jgi:hypothetical protein